MKRYNAVQGGVYDNSVMVEEKDGDYVWYEDVEHLQARNAELLEALKALIDNVGSCICYDESERECKAWEMAEAAIAKAKGEQP